MTTTPFSPSFKRPGPCRRLPITPFLIARGAAMAICLIALPTPRQLLGQTAENSIPAASAATVPNLIKYSGTLTDSRGYPITVPVDVTFSLYPRAASGQSGEDKTALWQETQQVSPNDKGGYTVYLGAATAQGLPTQVFNSASVQWLGVKADGEPEQARVLLVSVPYALKAGDAATLGGLPASAYALAGPTALAAAGAVAGIVTPDVTSAVTTTGGTSGTIPLFSGASTIVNSVLFQNTNGIGINNSNPNAALDINGKAIFRGPFQVARIGNASPSSGVNSNPFDFYAQVYDTSTRSNVGPWFQLQSEPTGNNTGSPGATFNLLYDNGLSGVASETGFYLNPNGTIHFAAGQTFPGGGSGGGGTITGVTAGAGLTGGGSSGNVTLALDTTKVPELGAANTFTGAANTFNASIYAVTDVNVDTSNSNNGSISPGVRLGSASGEGIASKRTSGGNQYGVDIYTDYTSRLSISAAGHVGIGPDGYQGNAQLAVGAAAGSDLAAIDAFGGSYAFGSGDGGLDGINSQGGYGTGGYSGGDGGYFQGGDTDGQQVGGYGVEVEPGGGDPAGYGTAGYFGGNVTVNGTLSANAKNFKIDHPLDPANKYLVHASVESSEMMNIYTGNVTTDELGLATVTLPDWFQAENTDFRYELTVIGGRFAQAIVSREVAGNQFAISTNAARVKVSWQITAVRQDAYAKVHPMVVEQSKPANERGYYMNPELYGQPQEKQTEWGRRPQLMQQRKVMREAHKAAAGARPVAASVPAQPSPMANQEQAVNQPTLK